MFGRILRKLAYHLALCLLVWVLILLFSPQGRLYAGWFVGFLSACYLLAGWLAYLKSRGTDLLRLIRRKRAPETPYCLRGPGGGHKPRLTLNGIRHDFEDDLSEAAEAQAAEVSPKARHQINAAAFVVNGVLLFLLSAVS